MFYDYFCTVEDRRCLFHEEKEPTDYLEVCSNIYRSRLADFPVYTIPGFLPVMLVHSRRYSTMVLNFPSANKGNTKTLVASLITLNSKL